MLSSRIGPSGSARTSTVTPGTENGDPFDPARPAPSAASCARALYPRLQLFRRLALRRVQPHERTANVRAWATWRDRAVERLYGHDPRWREPIGGALVRGEPGTRRRPASRSALAARRWSSATLDQLLGPTEDLVEAPRERARAALRGGNCARVERDHLVQVRTGSVVDRQQEPALSILGRVSVSRGERLDHLRTRGVDLSGVLHAEGERPEDGGMVVPEQLRLELLGEAEGFHRHAEAVGEPMKVERGREEPGRARQGEPRRP